MKKILIVAPYCTLPGDDRFNRFLYMSMWLSENNYDVTLVTSTFMHHEKVHRDKKLFNEKYNIVQLDERGYRENLCVDRFLSINDFTYAFYLWFKENHDFDVVLSAFPLIGTSAIIAKNKIDYGYKFILDIQDVWPESIRSAIPLFRFIPRMLLPFTNKANMVYRCADALIAVSDTYLNRALDVADCKNAHTLYIGSDFNLIGSIESVKLRNNKIKMFYIGALGPSYDIETIILGCNKLNEKGEDVELHLLGAGKELEKYKKIAGSNVVFYGQVTYKRMFEVIKSCDVALNALTANASQSVTNKLSDYFALGCPIINSSNNKEVLMLLSGKDSVNYKAGSVEGFCKAYLAIKPYLSNKWKPDYRFDRAKSYDVLGEIISSMDQEN